MAGPQSRSLLSKLTDIDLSNQAFPYMHMKHGELAGIPCRILRIGFVGELGYEIHFPAEYGLGLWNLILETGAEFGILPRITSYNVCYTKLLRHFIKTTFE